MTSYEFHDTQTLMGIVNDPTKVAQADEKPIYTPTSGNEAPDAMAHTTEGESLNLSNVEQNKAVYNEQTGELFGVVTDEYEIINAPEFFGPLASELKDRERRFSGDIHMFDGGAKGYAQILLDDERIYPQDRSKASEPVRCGFTVRWSHDGGISVRAEGWAQDGMCKNTMRRVTDSIHVKHAGDVDERVDFEDEWHTLLNQIGAFSETLEGIIATAWNYTVFDLSNDVFEDDWLDATDGLQALEDEEPPAFLTEEQRDGINGLYDLLGIPSYLSFVATTRLMWRLRQKADGEGGLYDVTAWDAYSALTYALTHEGRFDPGTSTDDRYHRIASDFLMNPQKALEDAHRELHGRVSGDDEQPALAENEGDAMREFKEREKQLRESLQTA